MDMTLDAQSVWVSFYRENNTLVFELADEGVGVANFSFADEEKEMLMKHIRASGILKQVDAEKYPQAKYYLEKDSVSCFS